MQFREKRIWKIRVLQTGASSFIRLTVRKICINGWHWTKYWFVRL